MIKKNMYLRFIDEALELAKLIPKYSFIRKIKIYLIIGFQQSQNSKRL